MTLTRRITNKLACAALAALMVITALLATTMDVNAASLSVKLTQSGSIYYDGGRAYTIHKYVTWTSGGKTYKRDAYCLQPSLAVPKSKKYSASQLGNTNAMAQCLYFANGAPGESAFRSAMKSMGLTSYIKNDNQYYAFMHIMLAYEYQGTKAFKIYGGGKLTTTFQNAVKKACQWCLSRNISQDASFAVTRSGSNAVKATFDNAKQKFITPDLTVTGAAGQSFSYTVPKNATLYYKTSSSGGYTAVAAGKTVTLKHGYYFHFEIASTATAGFTSTVNGDLKSLTAYKLTATSSTQNLAFFGVSSGVSASFKVTLTPLQFGTVKIAKVYKEYGSSTTSPEENAVFRIYNASFNSYADANDANTTSTPFTATVTTGVDGTAISGKLAVGTAKGNVYKVEQVSGKAGYKLAPDTTVTLANNQTVTVNGGNIVNEGFPTNLQITKVSESTGEVINSTGTSAAQYTVYKNEACTQSVGTITCTNGEGRLASPIAPGTYYVKETRTPTLNGIKYSLDETVHQVVLNTTVCEAEGTGNNTVYIKKVTYSDKEVAKHNLVIGKALKGPIAQSKTFDFTVNLKGLEASKTYSYVKLDKSTYEGMKSHFTNLSGYDFKDSAYSFLKNTNYTLANMRSDIITPYASVGTAPQVQTVTSNASGEANLSLNLKGDEAVIVFELPQTASYKVSEAGPTATGLEIIPAYKIDAPEGTTSLSANESNPGEALSTRWEAFPSKVAKLADGSTSGDYPVGVLYTNDGTVQHKLVIEKDIAGAGMDRSKSYDFALKLRFAGIFDQNPLPSTYDIPGYSIIGEDEYGNPVTVKKVEKRTVPVSGSDTQTFQFSLKAGEKLVMTEIPNDTYYTLAEKSGDYLRSAKTYQYMSGTSDKGTPETVSLANRITLGIFNDNNIVSGGSTKKLNISTTTCATTEIDVTNTARANKDTATNQLVLKKEANVIENNSFNFNIKLTLPSSYDGSTTPTYYAVGKGTDNWTISVSGGNVTVGNGTSTAAVPVILTRNDGKTVTLHAGNINPDTYIDNSSTVLAQWLTAPLIDSESWGSDILSVPFTANWLGTETEMVLSYSGGSPAITIPSTKTGGVTNVVTAENLRLQAITPGSSGSTVTIKAGEKLNIEGLLPGSSYKITESASTFKPSYVISRKTVDKNGETTLGEDSGNPNEALESSTQTLPASGAYIDTASFMNEKETDDLSVSKETSDQNPTKEFDYTVDLYGSSLDGTGTYKAVVPGNKTFDITIDEDGNMQIVQLQGTTTSLADIPVKIIRPDKKTRTVYTDADGYISADDYVDWLRETEKHDTFDFTVTFLGTEVIMTCDQ